jgi:DNA-binding MarR family transcriptional regulator
MNTTDEGFSVMDNSSPEVHMLVNALRNFSTWSLSKVGAEALFGEKTSILIGLGLMIGLQHPVRRRIYDHLRRLPGDHFRSIARSLQLASGTMRYHLDTLIRNGLVFREKTNGRVRFYVNGGGEEAEFNRLYARHWSYRDLRLRVLFAVKHLEDARPSTIAKSLGISRQLAAYHLAHLEEAGQVVRRGSQYFLE